MIPKTVSRLALIISNSCGIPRSSIVRTRSTLIGSYLAKNGLWSDMRNRTLLEACCSTHNNYQHNRFKHKKRGAKENHEEEDDDYDSDDEVEEPGSKIVTGHMASLRADLVLKFGLGIARNKVETLFYESKIRVNGSKIQKKSQKVYIGDEIDVIKGPSPVNENMTLVSRVVVLNAIEHDDGDKLVVKMRRYKSLTIDSEDSDRM